MITAKTKHYYKNAERDQFFESATHHFSPGSDAFSNDMYLINVGGELTNLEEVPDEIKNWVKQIGFDHPLFPSLVKLWGFGRSEYAFMLRYEISHEKDINTEREYPIVLPYYEQLKLLMEAAEKIAQAIPYALVRIHEMGSRCERHDIEMVFLYPCDPNRIRLAIEILNSQFDYVWDIGRELVESAADPLLSGNIEALDAKKKEFEFALPNGMILVANTDGDDAYPGIFISLKEKTGAISQLCCFVELNSDKSEGKQIYIGAYTQNADDPTYYACYHEDGQPCEDV